MGSSTAAAASTSSSDHHLLLTFMIHFVVYDHIIGPKSESSGIAEAVINVLAAKDDSNQLVLVLLILE